MTKLKSKKMTKSTIAIIVMAIALVALLAFGGTYAYFTASTASASGSVTTGKIALATNQALILVGDGVVPGDQLLSSGITYTNSSTVNSYVFVTFSATMRNAADTADIDITSYLTINIASGSFAQLMDDQSTPAAVTGVYYKLCSTSDTALTVCDSITFNAVNNYYEGAYDSTSPSAGGTASAVDVEGATITVSVNARSIQARSSNDAWTSPYAAYTALNGLTLKSATPAQADPEP